MPPLSRRPKAPQKTPVVGTASLKPRPTPEPSRWWTVEGVAAHLKVSQRSVRRWVRSGDLPSHRFGRSIRIANRDLIHFERSRIVDMSPDDH